MNPAVVLLHTAVISGYLYPDNLNPTDLEDWELGGIGLSDATQGLQVQAWHLSVLVKDNVTSVYVDAPNTPSTQLFTLAGITWARLSFDQNMHPVISYVAGTGPGFWWYDPLLPGTTFTALPSTVVKPCVTLDDKRDIQTRLGNSDVVMCYVNNDNLCYRLERERYQTEHIWFTSLSTLITVPYVNRIGMSNNYRLLIELHGALYQ